MVNVLSFHSELARFPLALQDLLYSDFPPPFSSRTDLLEVPCATGNRCQIANHLYLAHMTVNQYCSQSVIVSY